MEEQIVGMVIAQAAGGGMSMILMIVVMFAIMYFMVLRPQRKEQKRVRDMLASMEIGDSVVTTSGFYGKILDLTDEDVIVEFGNNKNCRIPMRKGAIAEVEKAAAAYAAPAETKKIEEKTEEKK